jgi:hypothetical protein
MYLRWKDTFSEALERERERENVMHAEFSKVLTTVLQLEEYVVWVFETIP